MSTLLNCETTEYTYNPGNLLNKIAEHLELKSDFRLSLALESTHSKINHIRNRRIPVGANLLLKMHDLTGLSIKELRALMGDHRNKFVPLTVEKSVPTEAVP